MREILFKGKRLNNGEWIEGDLIQDKKEGKVYIDSPELTLYMPSVLPETICQYTGETDINGNRIWENDIVKSKYSPNRIVKFGLHNIHCCGCCYDSHQSVGFYLDDNKSIVHIQGDSEWEDLEVIGNIFDNPELLEVK